MLARTLWSVLFEWFGSFTNYQSEQKESWFNIQKMTPPTAQCCPRAKPYACVKSQEQDLNLQKWMLPTQPQLTPVLMSVTSSLQWLKHCSGPKVAPQGSHKKLGNLNDFIPTNIYSWQHHTKKKWSGQYHRAISGNLLQPNWVKCFLTQGHEGGLIQP